MNNLSWLNHLPIHHAQEELLKCCGSKRWAEKMALELPIRSLDELMRAAEKVWLSLEPQDWLEAFRKHPRIGGIGGIGGIGHIGDREKHDKWTAQEQKGVAGAPDQVMQELSELNQVYEKKFGHVFLVCATGKKAEEMLDLLKTRMTHSASQELQIAAKEQMKITEIRLRKLLHA